MANEQQGRVRGLWYWDWEEGGCVIVADCSGFIACYKQNKQTQTHTHTDTHKESSQVIQDRTST